MFAGYHLWVSILCGEVEHGSAEYWATVELRRDILRTPLGLDFIASDLEAEFSDFHLAAFSDQTLVGCLVLTPLGDDIKMRQVAVAADQQGRGVGKELVRFSESFSSEKGFRKMVLNARDSAVPFYLRLGYESVGEPFEEVTIPHLRMERQLGLIR